MHVVILAAILVKACVCFRFSVFSAHKDIILNVGAHYSVRHTCFFVHVCDGAASLSGVVSVCPAVSHAAPFESRSGHMCEDVASEM